MNTVKILFYAVALLTTPILISLFWGTSYASTDVYFENELIILNRDAAKDTVKEYQIKVDLINETLLSLKMEQEWMDLKLLHIREQDRIAPQVLVESRKKIIKKQLFLQKKKKRLMELIEKHRDVIKKLDDRIKENSGLYENLSQIGEAEIDETFDERSHEPVYSSPDIEKELKGKIKKMDLQDWVELIKDGSGIRMEVRLPILFASGKSTSSESYKAFLKKLARFTKPYQVLVHVKGFTDKLKSKKISNIELGADRAAKIVNLLVKYGMSPSVFKITSRGEHQKGSHVDKSSLSFNRRAEITVYFQFAPEV